MSELKTLNDIKMINLDPKDNWVSQKQLRKEAIKWIKNLKKDFPDYPNIGSEPINWIKHFFNIKKEDLK